MSVTEVEIRLTPPSAPPAEVDPEYAARRVDPQDVSDLSTEQASTHQGGELERNQSQASQSPTRGPFAVSRDEEGGFVVQDVLGAVYGAGPTFDEAIADFIVALDDHLAFLRERRDELHSDLVSQLATLERLFPGR